MVLHMFRFRVIMYIFCLTCCNECIFLCFFNFRVFRITLTKDFTEALTVSPAFASYSLLFPPPGLSISVVEEDKVQQLFITDVKAGGLAFAKG